MLTKNSSVAEIVEQFERECSSEGSLPSIDDYLAIVPESKRSELLLELLLVELKAKSERGIEPELQTYLLRYPEHAESIRKHFSEAFQKTRTFTARQAAHSTATHDFSEKPNRGRRNENKSEKTVPPADVDEHLSRAGYRVISTLGAGGMGVVYLAEQLSLGRQVALKMILDRLASKEALKRFETEAKVVAELNDNRFVQIYEFGMAGDKPYMVLEYVPGGSLESRRHGEPLTPREAANMVKQISEAMDHAHAAGYIHRDLKPHNILLTAGGTPKVADFGLVKRLSPDASQMTMQGTVMGTASYMAPEQSRGEENVGPAADVHALGAILYCLLTGRPPYLAANVHDTIMQVREAVPVPPSRLQPEVHKDLETICLKCLEKQPVKRYQTAAELAEDLNRFLDGRPILARPVSIVERGWRWSKRKPAAATALALTCLIAVASPLVAWRLANLNLDLSKQTTAALKAQSQAESSQAAKSKQYNEIMLASHFVLNQVDQVLRDDPTHTDTRLAVNQKMLDSLKKIQDESEDNPLQDRNEAVGLQRTADIMLIVGESQVALDLYEDVAEIVESLAKSHPDDASHVRNLGGVCNKLADVHERLGNTEVAKQHLETGLQYRMRWEQMRLAEKSDNHFDAKQAIAQSHAKLGRVSLALGKPKEALEHFQQSQTWYRKLPRERLIHPLVFPELAGVEHFLAEAHDQLGQFDEAENFYQRVISKRKTIINNLEDKENLRKSSVRAAIQERSRSELKLGDFYFSKRGDLTKALNQYKAAYTGFKQTFDAVPGIQSSRAHLANIEYRLGAILEHAEEAGVELEGISKDETAAQHFARCLELRTERAELDPNDMQAKLEWGLALARCGEFDAAQEQAEALAEKGNDSPWLQYQASCILALCSRSPNAEQSKQCREAAFVMLERLVEGGWSDAVALRYDPDLEPLREDERLNQILIQAEADSSP